jgi:hypothetical protein
MVTGPKINLGKYTCSSKLIEKIIDPGPWVHVFDDDYIESMIVNTHPLCAVFLRDKNNMAPHGDELGRIYPFPSSSRI